MVPSCIYKICMDNITSWLIVVEYYDDHACVSIVVTTLLTSCLRLWHPRMRLITKFNHIMSNTLSDTCDYSRFPLGSCWSVFSLREWNSMHSSFFAISLLLNCLNQESTNLKLSIQALQESPVWTNRTSYFQHSYSCLFGIFCLLYTGIVQQNNWLKVLIFNFNHYR